jgi:hypothetical protein
LGLDNAGTATWSGSANTFFVAGAVFNNQAGATFTAQNDEDIAPNGTTGTFNNMGTFAKGAGTGKTLVTIPFFNMGGTLDAVSGTLELAGGGADTGGTCDASAGATLDLNGSTSPTLTGTYTGAGAGTVTASAGLTVGTGGATFNFPGHLLQLGRGTIILGANTMTIARGSTLTLLPSATFTGTGALLDQGAINASGSMNFDALTLTIGSRGTMTMTGGGGSVFGTGTLANQGTLNFIGGQYDISIPLNNTGTLQVHNTTVDIFDAVTQVSGGTLTAGKWEVFGTATVHSTLSITTAGSAITTIGGQATVELSGPNTSFTNIGGLTTNQGSFLILGGQTFTTAGDFTDSGKLTLGPASTLAVNRSYTQTSTGTLTIDFSKTSFGQIVTTGGVSLGGTLSISIAGTEVPRTYEIISNGGAGPVTGTFAKVKTNKGTATASYTGGDGNDVTVTLA